MHALTRRAFTTTALSALAAPAVARAQQLDKISFGTNWVAEAEHGGFYQAVADGTYRKYGHDVTIVPGGPQVNNRMLLLAGRIDFFMSANCLQAFDAVAQNIPVIAEAAIFQKDPQVLLAHSGAAETFEDLKNLTLFVSSEGLQTYYKWMQAEFGFSESQTKPYTFNPQPFPVDRNSAMQGYVTSEPFAVEKAGVKAKIFLLADQGFNTYSTLIEARRETGGEAAGPGAALRRCLRDRLVHLLCTATTRPRTSSSASTIPRWAEELIAYSIARMKEYGIVDSGDTLKARHRRHDAMRTWRASSTRWCGPAWSSRAWIIRKSYTLQFVNKGVGLELRPK